MKYLVRKELPGAKVGDILTPTYEGPSLYSGNDYLIIDVGLIQDALDQGFIEPYEEKPKRILTENVIEGLNLEALKSGKSYMQQAIYQLEEAILKLQDNEVSDEQRN